MCMVAKDFPKGELGANSRSHSHQVNGMEERQTIKDRGGIWAGVPLYQYVAYTQLSVFYRRSGWSGSALGANSFVFYLAGITSACDSLWTAILAAHRSSIGG